MNIVERTKTRWNKAADKFNQWEELSLEEILSLIIEEEKISQEGKIFNDKNL